LRTVNASNAFVTGALLWTQLGGVYSAPTDSLTRSAAGNPRSEKVGGKGLGRGRKADGS